MDGATVALKDVVGMAVPLLTVEGLWVMTEDGGVVDWFPVADGAVVPFSPIVGIAVEPPWVALDEGPAVD